ncbi:MAG: zinc-ribbon and DUF3426 domain-containing protein [Gammaproteobacteria bacterium]|nr:zinc-ribbon and DUF3426 domain-containing protein [Gammaproteobacteria bacterium]
MLTRCPQCFAWFRVRAEHLSLAKGLVTCGRCEHVFNALESLIEEAPAPPAPPRIETAVEPALHAAAPPSPSPSRAAPEPLRFVTVSATTTLAPSPTPASPSTPSQGPALAAPLAAPPALPAPVEAVAPPPAAPLSFVTLTAQASLTPRVDSAPLTVTTGAARATALTALAGVAPVVTMALDSPPVPPEADAATQANDADDEDLALDALPSFAPDDDVSLDAPPPLPRDADFDLADAPPVALFDEFDEAPPPPPPEEDLDIGPVSRGDDEVDISDFDFSAVDERAEPVPDEHDEEPGDDTDPHALAHLHEAPHSAPPPRPLPLDPNYVPPHAPDDEDARDDTDPHALAHLASESQAGAARTDAADGEDDDVPVVMNEIGVPAVLAADLAALAAPPRASSWRAFLWASFAFVLALGALLQAAFMERQAVVAALPEAGAVIDALCAHLPCLERRAQVPTVRLLARDVREHPSYRDALLVNATIMNDGKTPTPYPVIDLRLRDAAGNVLSARRFEPREYLDQSIAVEEGMPPERPVYIVLELAGNASNAVSFEFTFL